MELKRFELIDCENKRESFKNSLVDQMANEADFVLLCNDSNDGREFVAFESRQDGIDGFRISLVCLTGGMKWLDDAVNWLEAQDKTNLAFTLSSWLYSLSAFDEGA